MEDLEELATPDDEYIDALEYESKMAQQMIDILYEKEN